MPPRAVRSSSRSRAAAAPHADRAALVAWLAIALVVLVLHALGATVLRDVTWGTHAYAFLPRAVFAAAAFLLVAACAVAVRAREATGRAPSARRPPIAQAIALRVVAALAGTALLGWARVRHTSLGDGGPLSFSIASGQSFHPDSPLTFALLQAWHRAWAPAFGDRHEVATAVSTIGLATATAGGLFALVAWEIAGEMSRAPHEDTARPRLRALLAATIALQGYALIFFGYVEAYAFVAVLLAIYAWLALRVLRGAAPLWTAALALGVAVAFHLMATVFLPTFAILAATRLWNRGSRRRTLVELGAMSALALGAVVVLAGRGGAPDLIGHFVALARIAASGEGGEGIAGLLGRRHLENVAQAMLLVGPLGVLGFVAAVTRRPRGAVAVFAAVTGLFALAAMFLVQDLRLGYARDWDLNAAPGVLLAFAALALWSPRTQQHTPAGATTPYLAIGLIALATSLFHTAPWVAVNASRARAFARLQTLPLGYGRTEMAVAFWLSREGDVAGAEAWTQRALDVNPRNLAAWLLWADIAQRRGSPADEARALKRATVIRPGEVRFRARLLDALRRAGRLDIARDEARAWASEMPGDRSAVRMAALLEDEAADAQWEGALREALAREERTPIR